MNIEIFIGKNICNHISDKEIESRLYNSIKLRKILNRHFTKENYTNNLENKNKIGHHKSLRKYKLKQKQNISIHLFRIAKV